MWKRSLSAVLCTGLLAGVCVRGANPLGFREYTQQFTLSFRSAADAAAAKVSVRPLPGRAVLACSSRWDDSTLGHLKTVAVMDEAGVPGTFFNGSVGGVLKQDPDYLKKLLKGGSSIGLHTVHHPSLPLLDPNAHFEEYMANRIELETESQTAINSQALPFCQWGSEHPMIAKSIGWAMRATGVIGSPDVMYPDLGKHLGYPAGTFAMSRFIAPGDREPDIARLKRELDGVLKNTKALSEHPSVTLGIHSWHTKDGLEKLRACYAFLAGRPDWWYCNQTQYGAYRYEANHAAVSARTAGSSVTVEVTRMEPFELGDALPLWLTVSGAEPTGISGADASLKEGAVELCHGASHRLPVRFARMNDNGTPDARMPFASLKLTRDGLKFAAELRNLSSEKPLEGVQLTFRFPSVYESEVLRASLADVSGGGAGTASVVQPGRKTAQYYRYGQPYVAVQADFVRDGEACRLYAVLKESRASGLPVTLNERVTFWSAPAETAETDWSALSRAGAPLSSLTPLEGVSADGAGGCGTVYPKYRNWTVRRQLEGKPAVLAVELEPSGGSARTVRVMTNLRSRGGESWVNGRRIEVKGTLELPLEAGRNRIVMRLKRMGYVLFFVEDEQAPCVVYQTLER